MQNKKKQLIRPFLFLFAVIILLFGCQKQKIKKHYTGNFSFTQISTMVIYNNGPDSPYTYVDTLVSNGSIGWVEKTTSVIISYSNESGSPVIYQVNVDNHGYLTLFVDNSIPADPHVTRSLEGQFVNDNEVNFTAYVRVLYMGESRTTTVVTGTRL